MMRVLFFRIVLAAALAGLAAGFIATHQASAAELRPRVEIDGAIVTLGDLFDGAGALAGRAVFRAPALGVSGALPAAEAVKAAVAAGLAIDSLPSFDSVAVVRRAVTVDAAAITSLVADAAAARLGVAVDNLDVSFDGSIAPAAAHAAGLHDELAALARTARERGVSADAFAELARRAAQPASLGSTSSPSTEESP